MNPHNVLQKVCDHPGANCRLFAPHSARWRCYYCGKEGTLSEVNEIECGHVYPPCKSCGETPTCAADCDGVWAALGSPGVRVIG